MLVEQAIPAFALQLSAPELKFRDETELINQFHEVRSSWKRSRLHNLHLETDKLVDVERRQHTASWPRAFIDSTRVRASKRATAD